MDAQRAMQRLIPVLYGIGVGILAASITELLLPGRDAAAKYVGPVGIAALLVSAIFNGISGDAAQRRTFLRRLVPWIVIVLALLGFFTLLQRT